MNYGARFGLMAITATAAMLAGCTAGLSPDDSPAPDEETGDFRSSNATTATTVANATGAAESATLLSCQGPTRTTFAGSPADLRIAGGLSTLRNCVGAGTSIQFVKYRLDDTVQVNCADRVAERQGSVARLTMGWSDGRTSVAIGPMRYVSTAQAGGGGSEALVFTLVAKIERGPFVGKSVALTFGAMPAGTSCGGSYPEEAFAVGGLAKLDVF